MDANILEFQGKFNNNKISTTNIKIDDVIKEYSFQYIQQEIDILKKINIVQNFKKSKVIILDQYTKIDQKTNFFYFMITFKKTIFLIEKNNLKLLHSLFSSKNDLNIFFLSDIINFFKDNITIKFNAEMIDYNFKNDLHDFRSNFIVKKNCEIETTICNCTIRSVIAFLIKNAYLKIPKNRIENFSYKLYQSSPHKIISDNEYIKIRMIESGASGQVFLIYHITKEKLLAIKNFFGVRKNENFSYNREINHYYAIQHPLLPKFYGKSYPENSLIIEFIKGKTLYDIDKLHLNDNDKITIIFQLMVIIEFLHRNHYIYRDLKPNNIMMDENKNIVLIDFDRMLNIQKISNDEVRTLDFSSSYAAPELSLGKTSYKCDIYSLGKMMQYIIASMNNHQNYEEIINMINRCINENPVERPSILDVILEFYI